VPRLQIQRSAQQNRIVLELINCPKTFGQKHEPVRGCIYRLVVYGGCRVRYHTQPPSQCLGSPLVQLCLLPAYRNECFGICKIAAGNSAKVVLLAAKYVVCNVDHFTMPCNYGRGG